MADSRVARWLARVALLVALGAVISAGHGAGYDSREYLHGARALLGEGDYAQVRYPPGYPVLLAAADGLAMPPWWVTTCSGLVLVALLWWGAVQLAGPLAGIAAGAFAVASSLIADSGHLLMADTPAAVFAVGGLLAVMRGRWTLAGLLVGASTWVRLAHGAFALGLFGRRRAFVTALATMVPLAVFNLIVFGAFSTYGPNQVGWSFVALTEGVSLDGFPATDPNWVFYLSVLGGRWGHLLPLLPVLAGVEMWRRRTEPATRLAVVIVVTNLLVYLFYFFQSARFVLPTAAVVVLYASALVGRVGRRVLHYGAAPCSSSASPVASAPASRPPARSSRSRAR